MRDPLKTTLIARQSYIACICATVTRSFLSVRRYMPEDGNIYKYNMLVFRNTEIVQKKADGM
jgi:hypothetical protein